MTSHDKGLRVSKSSSPSEELDSRILKGYYRVKELNNLGPLYTEPKAHAEKEEMPESEQRRSKFPRDIVEDNPVLGQPRS